MHDVTPPEHNIMRIVEPMVNGKERLRKLSVDEHFRLMGFIWMIRQGKSNFLRLSTIQNWVEEQVMDGM